mmetsp:Transcript_62078/g.161272  ORF Transcript_62078/g.161272 Transcript_62078/m.161272 type:complete len:248 (-) Transcript_62078:30-773(-)
MCHSRGTTSSVSYDCAADLANWETGWSARKKEWCCKRESRGCGGAAAPSGAVEPPTVFEGTGEAAEDSRSSRYDCDAELWDSEANWSVTKRSWCCEHLAKGCPASTTSSGPYDCRRGLFAWSESWPEEKKWWCCKTAGLGCAPAPSPADFADETPGPTTGQKLRAGTEELGAGRAHHAAGGIGVGLRRLLPAAVGWEEGQWSSWAPTAGAMLVAFPAGCLLRSACGGACCSPAGPAYRELPRASFAE